MEEQRVRAGAGPIPSAHLGFVDAAKGLGILAVIWGHMDYLWSTSSVWFSSFKLAVFFVVVGLLKARRYEARGQEESCGAVWGKRLYSLVIPYGVYSLLAILAHLAFAAVRHQGIREALGGDIFLTITLRGIATLWFLPTLLLAELLFAAIRPESRCRAVKLLLCILMPVLLWAVCWFYERVDLPEGLLAQAGQNLFVVAAKSVSGCWFMLCGYYIYRHLDPKRLSRPLILVVLLAVNLGLSLLSPKLDFNSFRLGRFGLVFYVNGVLGSVAVLELLRYLEGRVSLRPLIWCGKNSLFLMATHLPWYIAPVLVAVGKRFYTAAAPDVKYFLVMLAEFAALMAIEFVMVRCKDRIKDAMTGRWGKERPICKAVKYL